MGTLAYQSGEDIQERDRVRYHGEPGYIDFVVRQASGNPSGDCYLEQFPGGGAMIVAEGFGSVFLDAEAIDDFLEFVSRA